MVAPIRLGVFSVVEITAGIAKLRHHHSAFDSTGRQYTPCHPVFATLVVNDIARAELSKPKESWAINNVNVFASRHQSPQRKAREVVSRQESFACEIAIRIEVRFQ